MQWPGAEEGGVSMPRAEPAELERLRARVTALEEQVHGMFAGNGAIKLFIDPDSGAVVGANPAAAAFYGYSIEELLKLNITDLNQLPDELVRREMERARGERRTWFEFMHRLKSGELRHVEVYSAPCQVEGRQLLFSIIFDITDRKRLAEELAQTQRMDALGRMAGGVAHDFNNLLTAVEMLRSLIERKLLRGLPVDADLAELKSAVARGAAFTGQLLAFCRRQPIAPVLVDVAQVVRDLEPILRRLADERIALAIAAPGSAPVVADRSQIEQVILNLAINATDAMAQGGRLTLTVGEELLDEATAARLGVAAEVVELCVQDTGVGIAPELHERIFEPFFTSKPSGRGTGLGLATVYGIAKQSGGSVAVESSPGAGALFRVWLPRARIDPPPMPLTDGLHEVGGEETILVAEDEDSSRHAIVHLLAEVGYRVLEARDGEAALTVARAHDGPLHLLLSDVVMPAMGGPELAKTLLRERPELHVLYMSGYVDSPIVDHGLLDASQRLLAKPFTLDDLLRSVRQVLDAPPRRGRTR
jgi:two-component system, cell cycle sensor histidine kinase and response regulator CckA